MLWPLLEQLHRLLGVAVAERLHKVRVLGVTVRAGHAMAVVAVEVEPLVRVQQQLEAVVALKEGMIETVRWLSTVCGVDSDAYL